MGRDGGAGGLLEAVGGPQEAPGIGPEPGRGPPAQAYLGERQGHERGVDTLGAEPGHDRQVVVWSVVGEVGQQASALGGDEEVHLGGGHALSLSRRLGTLRLALELTEC